MVFLDTSLNMFQVSVALHIAYTGLKWVKYYHCLLLTDPIEVIVAII